MARQRKKKQYNEAALAIATCPQQQSYSTQGQRQSARIRGRAPEYSYDVLSQDKRERIATPRIEKPQIAKQTPRRRSTVHSQAPPPGHPRKEKAELQINQSKAPWGAGSKRQRQDKPESYEQPFRDQRPISEHQNLGIDSSRISPGFERMLERNRTAYVSPHLLRPDSDGEETSTRSSMTSHSQLTLQTETTAKKRIKSENSNFDECMYARNADLEESPSRDEDKEVRRQVVPSNDKLSEIECGTYHISESWNEILKSMRCQNGTHFTITIFFNLINMYKDFLPDGRLDHAINCRWKRHQELPSRDPELLATRPKPDIFIGFRPAAILQRSRFFSLGKEFRRMMVPADTEAEDSGIAFPFLIMEAMGSSPLVRRVVNDASNALHNLWKFFERAGEERQFFDQIRVFTMAGSSERMTVRMHYALQEENHNDWINQDYPLKFQYEVLLSQATDFPNCRSFVQNILTNILTFTENNMLPQIQQAVDKVLNKFDKYKAAGPNDLQAAGATRNEAVETSSPSEERMSELDAL